MPKPVGPGPGQGPLGPKESRPEPSLYAKRDWSVHNMIVDGFPVPLDLGAVANADRVLAKMKQHLLKTPVNETRDSLLNAIDRFLSH